MDILKEEGLAVQIFPHHRQFRLSVKGDPLGGVRQFHLDRSCPFPLQQQADRQRPGGVVLHKTRPEPQVGQMEFRLGVEENGAENAGQVPVRRPRPPWEGGDRDGDCYSFTASAATPARMYFWKKT